MAKQFLYIVDPLCSLNANSDTTLALMAEAGARGVANFACEISEILVQDGKLRFHAAPVEIFPGYKEPPSYRGPKKLMDVDEFKVVFMRKDPPVNENFMAALFMLKCHDAKKTLFINHPDGLLIANEKLYGQDIAAEYFPPTLISSQKEDLLSFARLHQTIVFKPLFGAGGSGVMVFEADDLNINAALDVLSASFSRPMIAQKYIKNARLGDKRILLLGGEILGSVLRIPHESDHRANFHAGGRPEASTITSREKEICAALKPHLLAWGLHFVGIDVIDGFLTEINVTSPTCILQMEKGLSAQVIDYIFGLIA